MNPEDKNLVLNDHLVQGLRHSVKGGAYGLADAPQHLSTVLEREAWKERVEEQTGEVVRFESFEEFVTTPPLEGLGATISIVERLIKDDGAATKRLRNALKQKPGPKGKGARSDKNLTRIRRGWDRTYILQRLDKERPDLATRVAASEISVNAAAIEAGYLPHKAKVPVDTAEAAMRALHKRFTWDELRAAIPDEESTP